MKSSEGGAAGAIERYLEGLGADQRAALERVRRTVRSAAPLAEECIAYGVPAFRYRTKALAGYSASAHHCSFFPMNGRMVAEFAEELRGFETSKGTVRFQPGKPIPVTLLRKMVKRRMAEIDGAKR